MPNGNNKAASGEPLRVLVLSKRQYMARDLIDDRYGRFRELPLALGACGVTTQGLCLSYRRRPEGLTQDRTDDQNAVIWNSLNLHRLLPLGPANYWRELGRIDREFQPHVIWACSDVPHAVLGAAAARRLGTRLVIDLYDNFEGYPSSHVPGVKFALRRAIHAADGVTCVSSPLARMVRERYRYQGHIATIENAIPPGVFMPADKQASRQRFGLPADALLIGTAGALSRGRGTDFLIEAFMRLSRDRSDVHLVLAGPVHHSLTIPDSDRIHYLGLLPSADVPHLLPAFDISVIGNRDSAFGRYCFPQKLYESLACQVPVAVAGVGAMLDLLSDYPECLYDPESIESLQQKLEVLSRRPVLPDLPIPSWQSLGGTLASFLRAVATPGASH